MCKVFFTSDQHFFHANIIRYCNRPFNSVEEMNNVLFHNWNNIVLPEDAVYCLGDVGFKLDLISKLNGKKFLIRGNHDRSFSDGKLIRAGFTAVFKELILSHENNQILLTHRPIERDFGFKYNFCGHIHDTWVISGDNYNVGVDVRKFTPVTFKEIMKNDI